MPTRRTVLFDLYGVLAPHQRPGAVQRMADRCGAPVGAFTEAYWSARRPYGSGRYGATDYWTNVLRQLSRPADARTVEELRRADTDSWSRIDDRTAAYARSLHARAEVAVLSNIPADHADALLAAQPWLHTLDHLALSGRIHAAEPDPAAFRHCAVALRAAPADFLFVDDREENVSAAEALGMNGHHFTRPDTLEAAIDAWLPAHAA
ncbi:HAD family hydrolase [Streptomyces sp. NRRL B-24484]|uniref:HAD family hydrolase n=1 Tax=Streptomyces sp. NRRL B-24484 TaxID=1463833 RepID=UPI0004C0DF2D|nr:HAD family phosphatase [Streptomyces sp. NRRL B-24484]